MTKKENKEKKPKKFYYQGYFKPKHPKKYKGNLNNIFYRSFWERRFMKLCDETPTIIEWSSEETIITYISPVDNNFHRYFVDFKISMLNKNKEKETLLIEVKPLKEVYSPSPVGKKKIFYQKEVMTYLVNQAKWKAAQKFCDKRGWFFYIATDKKAPKSRIDEKIDYKLWKFF